MKRRILSLFISLALCLTLCPAPALAEGGEAVNPAQTVTGGETPENTEPAESTPGGDITEGNPDVQEGDEEKPEDTETKPESPEPPVETPPSGSGEDSPSADNGESTLPPGTQEDGSPANPPAGDGQAAAQPPAKAPAATEPDAEAGTGTDGLCTHHTEHTADCGYAAADETNEEKPCTYDCKFCPIEEKISALPESVTAANKETVQTQVDEIAALLAALAEGESANVFNLSAYEDIKQQLETPEPYAGTAAARVEKEGQEAIEVDTLEEAFTAENSGAMVTLLKDVVVEKPIPIPSGSFTLDLGGHNINYENTNGLTLFSIQGQSALMVQGSGTITTQLGTIIQVLNGGTLILNGGTFSGTSTLGSILIATNGTAEINEGVSFNYGSDVAVNVNGGTATINGGTIGRVVYNQGTLNLYGGTFSNISSNSQSLKDLLSVKDDSTCYAYYLDGELIKDPNILAGKELTGDITVKECTHEEMQITPNEDGTTHNKTCPSCNLPPVENEPCTFQPTPGKEPTSEEHFGTCPACGRVQDGAHDFTEWSADGKRTCTVCGLEQEAVAKCKDLMHSTTTFITDLQEITKPGVYYEVTLIKDVELTAPIILPEEEGANIQLDLAGHTVQAGDFSAFQVNTGSNFVINKSETGQIINNSPNNATIEINNGSFTFFGGNVTNTSGLALNLKYEYVHSARYGSSILIYGGRFSGGIRWLCTGGSYLKEFAPYVAFYDENDNLITEHILDAAGTLPGVITVKECTHKGQLTDNGDGTHGGKCPACNTVLTPEPHVWDTTGDIPVCTGCGVQAIAEEKNETSGETKYIAEFQEEYATSTNISIKLLQDVDLGEKQIFLNGNQSGEYKFALDLNGHTLSSNHSSEAVYVSGFEFTLKDSSEGKTGKIEGGEIGINIRGSAAILNMEGGTVFSKSIGLFIADDFGGSPKVQLTGGVFQGPNCIFCQSSSQQLTLRGILASGYAYYQDGKPLPITETDTSLPESNGSVTVKLCAHEGQVKDNGDGTHGGACAGCGRTLTSQPHVWDETGDIPVCTGCNVKAIAKTEKDGQTEYITKLKETYGEDYQGTTLTLLQDIDLGEKTVFISAKEFTLDLNGHTLRSNVGNGTVNIAQEGHLTLVNKEPFGEIASNNWYAVKVYGTLNMESGRVAGSTAIQAKEGCTININGGEIAAVDEYSNGLQIHGDFNSPISANIKIFGGSFYGKRCINIGSKSGHTLTSILPEGYAYYQNGKPIPIPEADEDYQILDASEGPITVGECDHSIAEYVNQNNGTHKLTCTACGLVEDQAACTYGEPEAVDANNHSSVCEFCGYVKMAEHGWEETTRTLNNGLTTEYFNKCSQCGYEQEPFGAVTTSAKNITLTYGETARLSAEAAFNKTVSYQWELGGGTLPGQTGSVYTTPADLAAGSYLYKVSIVPEGGKVYSFEFTVLVLPKVIGEAVIELNRNAFRYDGEGHSPEITSVKLGDTLLVEGEDYTANIPTETEAGSYTVTITGKGNYTGTATATFEINEVKEIPLPDAPSLPNLPEDTKVQLSVEIGLSEVPEGLKGKFDTPAKIENELRLKVTANLNGVKDDQIAVYDVRLQYLEGGVWKDVDPDNFPADGVTAVLPYPDGTDGTNYTFTVQHMISHGDKAGDVETLSYTAVSGGLQCHFTSLSPVAIGYKAIEKTPTPSTPSSPGTLFTDSGSDDDEEEATDPEYDFWQTVWEQIKKAKSGDTVKVNARGYDRMPATVMAALKKSNNVTLRIRWSGGEEIVIPSAKALSESLRIYYPLSYLEKYDFGDPVPDPDPEHLNPTTGGDIEVQAPVTAEAPLDAAGAPVVTDSRRGLAETEEQAEQGIEKAIPGVYQPETPGGEAVSPVEPAVSGQSEADRGGSGILPILLALLAAASCGVLMWWNRRNRQNSK